MTPEPFYEQPDPTRQHFVQPKAVRIVSTAAFECVVWKKGDGTTAATPVIAKVS